MPIVAPYREPPGTLQRAATLPSKQRLAGALLALALTALLAAPVVALAMQPFATVATLVAGALAAVTATIYARMCLSRWRR